MLNKLNTWLITRYPLLWNTRVVFVLPLVLLVHGLFYLAGYVEPLEFSDFQNYSLFRAKGVIMFSCLITVVILLIWLIYYLRNNPLKAHYPISKVYMFGEFFLLFVIFFSSATFFFTYRQGIYDQGRRLAAETNLSEEANTLNLAMHFIPMYAENFEAEENCDSISAREKRKEERLRIYNDSVKAGVKMDYNYVDDDPISYSDSLLPNYLNYCLLRISELETAPITSSEENSKRANSWLKEGRKDSVAYVLSRLQQVLQKYNVAHLYNPQAQADTVFSNSDFSINTFPYYNNRYDFESLDTSDVFLIEYGSLSDALNQIEEVRQGFWAYDILLGLLYYALAAAILLYSFRMIRIRIWFAALIGVGLWTIVLGLLFNLIDFRDMGMYYFLLILFLAFLGASILLIRSRKNKFASGLTFLWAIWSQLAVFPLILAIDMEANEYEQVIVETIDGPVVELVRTPFYTWMQDHIEQFFTLNIGLFLLLLIVIYIPLARKWQANPEE